MKVRIKDLRLRTTIGVFEWEQKAPRDVVVNIELEYDGAAAARSDELSDAVDYKALKRRILDEVEPARYNLLEKLAQHVLDIVLGDETVQRATVEVDKPHALRFSESVSVVCSGEKSE